MSTPDHPVTPLTPGAALRRDLAQALDHLVATQPEATIADLHLVLAETLRHLVDATLADLDRARYEERALLLAAFSTHPDLAAAVLTVDTDPWADQQRTTVLVLNADTGQMTWHIDDRDVSDLAHLPNHPPREYVALWDGADKKTTLDRLRAFTQAHADRGAPGPW